LTPRSGANLGIHSAVAQRCDVRDLAQIEAAASGTHLDHLFERRVLTNVPYPFASKNRSRMLARILLHPLYTMSSQVKAQPMTPPGAVASSNVSTTTKTSNPAAFGLVSTFLHGAVPATIIAIKMGLVEPGAQSASIVLTFHPLAGHRRLGITCLP
jgi:hypothetical protein